MDYVFYRASKAALNNITTAFDLVHPLNVSWRYTKSTLQNALNSNPSIDLKEVIPSEDRVHGVNYLRAFIETTLDEQEEKLAWLLLNNIFAIHEGWAAALFHDAFEQRGNENIFSKGLEYPGLSQVLLDKYVQPGSSPNVIENAFHSVYQNKAITSGTRVDFTKLDHYMLCYRFFKEARNCYMHGNFVASQRLLDAYNDYFPVANSSILGVNEEPEIIPPERNKRICLRLRGVIGFSDIVRRIIIISDITLIRAKEAEKEFLEQISEIPADKWTMGQKLSRGKKEAEEQIRRFTTGTAHFLKPTLTPEYKQFLIDNGVFIK